MSNRNQLHFQRGSSNKAAAEAASAPFEALDKPAPLSLFYPPATNRSLLGRVTQTIKHVFS